MCQKLINRSSLRVVVGVSSQPYSFFHKAEVIHPTPGHRFIQVVIQIPKVGECMVLYWTHEPMQYTRKLWEILPYCNWLTVIVNITGEVWIYAAMNVRGLTSIWLGIQIQLSFVAEFGTQFSIYENNFGVNYETSLMNRKLHKEKAKIGIAEPNIEKGTSPSLVSINQMVCSNFGKFYENKFLKSRNRYSKSNFLLFLFWRF